MKCPLCGYRFEENSVKSACGGCPMSGHCHLVRCPNCGYDIPQEPKLIKAFRAWRKKRHAD